MSRRRRITNVEILRRMEALERLVMQCYRLVGPKPLLRASMTPETRRQLVASDRAIRRQRVVPIFMANATHPRRNHAKVETTWGTTGDEA